ncbi:FimV/HubP family polar landmark protein, partial [Xanthomonas sp. MWU16-30325]|uniref:FimV/HubP family polar landmark protein n=1 Tax=Xanthomonas sp. MWU16-30325 TaxID=2878096 RepID=UPI001CF8CB33
RRVGGDALPAVRSGQTLSEIAAAVARSSGYSLDQTMLALLRTNPDAFIGGNINRLKQGAVLRTPQEDALAQVGAAEAAVMVREQAAQWRQARSAMPQPAEAGAAAATPAPAAAAASAGAGARLEIAPAVASQTNTAGATSGTSAEGEGDMAANQQLQQAREDIATRDAELQDLRTRVADLEKLKQQQQALIAMKDTDLAAAQKRLSETPAAAQQGSGFPLWLIGGLVLIVAAVVAWLAARRRKPSPLPPLPRRQFDFVPVGAAADSAEPQDDTQATVPSEHDVLHDPEFEQADLREEERAQQTQQPLSDVLRREPLLLSEPAAAPPVVTSDDWRSLRATPPAPPVEQPAFVAPEDAVPEPPRSAHAQPEDGPLPYGDVAHASSDLPPGMPSASVATQDRLDVDPAPIAPAAAPSAVNSREFVSAGRDRLELAVAYMDLGDTDTARGLLLEVAATGDEASRAEAAELLERLA